MSIAALVTWLATALGGFYMLGRWLTGGGARREGSSAFPVPVVFGHFLLAAAGLVVWVIYLFAGGGTLAWTAFVLLLPVALLGFVMFARWLGVVRTPVHAAHGAPAAAADAPAERSFPRAVVFGHGLLAVATLLLVLLTALSE